MPRLRELQAARAQLVTYSARLLDDGLAVGSAGNMSVRVGDVVAITPSGIGYAELRPADICLVTLPAPSTRTRPDVATRKRRPPRLPMHLADLRGDRRRGRRAHALAPRSSRCPRRATSCRPSTTRSPGSAARSASRRTLASARRAWPRRPLRRWTAAAPSILQNHGAICYGRDARARPTTGRCCWSGWPASTGWRCALRRTRGSCRRGELDEVAAESTAAPLRASGGSPADCGATRPDERRPGLAAPRGGDGRKPWTVLGAHILDVLGRPVEAIPPGQGSARLQEIRATAAGTAAGTGGRPGQARARGSAPSARSATTCSATSCWPRWQSTGSTPAGWSASSGAQTSATILPIRGNGERPALHVPGATRLLELADSTWTGCAACRRPALGAPDALGGPDRRRPGRGRRRGPGAAARWSLVDVLHPGSQQDLERLAGLLARRTGSARTAISCSP